MPDDAVADLDDAFLRLRRLWSASRQRIIRADGKYVEMSTLLVVEACARGASAGQAVSVSTVAAFADVAPSTGTRMVQRAVTAGYVQRGRTHWGPQRSALQLTGNGRILHETSVAARLRWLRCQLDGWPTGAVDDLAYLLHHFADTLDGLITSDGHDAASVIAP